MLNSAWNEVMIGRPYAVWHETAAAFIATLRVPCRMPKTNRAAASVVHVGACPASSSAAPRPSDGRTITVVLPCRSMSRPAARMPTSPPAASRRRQMLSLPSAILMLCWMVGIRAVQVPMVMPAIRNIRLIASRYRRSTSGTPVLALDSGLRAMVMEDLHGGDSGRHGGSGEVLACGAGFWGR